ADERFRHKTKKASSTHRLKRLENSSRAVAGAGPGGGPFRNAPIPPRRPAHGGPQDGFADEKPVGHRHPDQTLRAVTIPKPRVCCQFKRSFLLEPQALLPYARPSPV